MPLNSRGRRCGRGDVEGRRQVGCEVASLAAVTEALVGKALPAAADDSRAASQSSPTPQGAPREVAEEPDEPAEGPGAWERGARAGGSADHLAAVHAAEPPRI